LNGGKNQLAISNWQLGFGRNRLTRGTWYFIFGTSFVPRLDSPAPNWGAREAHNKEDRPMSDASSTLGFVVIVILYATIGFLAAVGTIVLVRKVLAPKAEQIFYAMFLIAVAAFYLAFTAYFTTETAWRLEGAFVAVFTLIALVGTRVPMALVVGYPLHGLWDMLHELHAHGVHSFFEPSQLTAIPLAYGFFCAVFDLSVAAYAYTRREDWNAAWKDGARSKAAV
jgi:hypothetical protein